MKKSIVSLLALTIAFFSADASITYGGKEGKRQIVNIMPELSQKDLNKSFHFTNLSKGLRLEVVSNVGREDIIELTARNEKQMQKAPIYISEIEPLDFVKEEMNKYLRQMGFIMYADPESDLTLRVTVVEFNAPEMSGNARTVLQYELLDAAGNQIIPPLSATGTDHSKMLKYDKILGKSLARAMSGIDWNSISYQLKDKSRVTATKTKPVAEKARIAEDEPEHKVKGDGDTALEHTIIRWYIVSAPQGADVSWRVVSSTPDVKNTNSNYVGTTPYETTESFDIRGLKFENAGNVQIEITCEKPGYLPQKKRFNVRQAIEQREISAKFNLVKEE